MYDLNGKVALVTGAGGEHGIGRAIAVRLAAEGADAVVSDLRDQPIENWGGLSAVADEIEAMSRRCIAVTADVTDAEQVDRLVASALEALGHIDILVNNAGAIAGPDRVPVVDLDEEIWDHVLRVNAKGPFLCSRAVARQMIQQGSGGKIINMSSTSGQQGRARFAAYCASKFAVLGFTQSLALELAPFNIRVNAICPGLTDTERLLKMAEGLRPADVPAETYLQQMVQSGTKNTPLGRIGRPEDVARVAAFLASDESEFLTGESVTVAGGAT
jgi:NAD(P)-dependent dehydrogenase (short-subunit alcohol dehydrogenase family)